MKATIAADRLLVYEIGDGWEPLCAFLGLPVPDEPFPQVNERAAFHRKRPARLWRVIVRGR
ncbi:sulfotransferase [Nonomuraea jiangxiensis]|uniref:sulfotransferase n=1 Tax=Nonomuraea jiangxiensis TaxID=633440 RepID=UPI00115FAA43